MSVTPLLKVVRETQGCQGYATATQIQHVLAEMGLPVVPDELTQFLKSARYDDQITERPTHRREY